jgi:CIC family chloride channel protein
VGIITRADIIRAESDQLKGQQEQWGPHVEPSYMVYQTQAPATGQGRLLVPIRNPRTLENLMRLSGAIARAQNYELDCLRILAVPRTVSPATTSVRIGASTRLLRKAERYGRLWQVPIHAQIRVAHDVGRAILETVQDRHANLLVLETQRPLAASSSFFGKTVDLVSRQALCDVLMVQWSRQYESLPDLTLNHWLVPISGGPNAQRAVQLLPALVKLSYHPAITLCQVVSPDGTKEDTSALAANVNWLNHHLTCPIRQVVLPSRAIATALLDLSEELHCDVILLGASRESLLQQALIGSVPGAIASRSLCTVMLMRAVS